MEELTAGIFPFSVIFSATQTQTRLPKLGTRHTQMQWLKKKNHSKKPSKDEFSPGTKDQQEKGHPTFDFLSQV